MLDLQLRLPKVFLEEVLSLLRRAVTILEFHFPLPSQHELEPKPKFGVDSLMHRDDETLWQLEMTEGAQKERFPGYLDDAEAVYDEWKDREKAGEFFGL